MKRILSIVCAIALALSLMVIPVNSQAATTKTAYFTIEKLTIGQGLMVQPTKVEIKDGDTVQTVREKVMKAASITAITKDTEYGSYLAGIKNADNGKLNIPKSISSMPDYEYGYMDGDNYVTVKIPAPSNEKNDGNPNLPDLGEFAYNSTSGWWIEVNNKNPNEGESSLKVNDGDVIRLQFSVFAYGADLGLAWEGSPVPNQKLANKDALIKKLADVKDNKDFSTIAAAKKAYEDGVKALENYDATDAEVKAAVSTIEKYENPEPVTVGKAAIKKIKNIKGKKAKITVKKVKGATGYIFKYSKKKNFKGAKTKDTKKLTIKTKKFKKKQTCYAKVQAYAVVNGTKHFGKWSKVKKVKIKK